MTGNNRKEPKESPESGQDGNCDSRYTSQRNLEIPLTLFVHANYDTCTRSLTESKNAPGTRLPPAPVPIDQIIGPTLRSVSPAAKILPTGLRELRIIMRGGRWNPAG